MQWLYELSGLAFAFMDIETVRYGMMEFVSVVLVHHDHSRKMIQAFDQIICWRCKLIKTQCNLCYDIYHFLVLKKIKSIINKIKLVFSLFLTTDEYHFGGATTLTIFSHTTPVLLVGIDMPKNEWWEKTNLNQSII